MSSHERPSHRWATPKPLQPVSLEPSLTRLAESKRIRPDLVMQLWDWDGDLGEEVVALDSFEEVSHLPKVLDRSPVLTFLSLPSRLSPLLRDCHLANVRGVLEFTGEGTVDLSRLTKRVSVQHLTGYKLRWKLDPALFPEVFSIDMRVTPKTSIRKWLDSFPKLKHLLLSPAHPTQLAELPEALDSLHLLFGHVESLQELTRVRTLTWLQLHSLPKLRDIEPLTELPALEEVTIAYCPHLSGRELLRCKKLRYVSTMACPDMAAVGKELSALVNGRGGCADL